MIASIASFGIYSSLRSNDHVILNREDEPRRYAFLGEIFSEKLFFLIFKNGNNSKI